MRRLGLLSIGLKLMLPFVLSAEVSASEPLVAPGQAKRAGFSDLIFFDDFNELDLSPDGGGTHKWYNSIWTAAPRDRRFFSIDSGILTMRTVPGDRKGSGTSITTLARDGSMKGAKFKFGYFEALVKFENGANNWAAFWLYSVKRSATRKANVFVDYHWCEIDIFESMYPRFYAGTVHDWSSSGDIKNSNAHMRIPDGMSIDDTWTKFGLLWQPSKISWYLNDVQVGEALTPSICAQDPMFLVIGAQKKGGMEDQRIDVDWVRVWGNMREDKNDSSR